MAAEHWLISGGTGLVGGALVRSLEAEGHRVSVFSRSENSKGGLRTIAWTPTRPGAWQQAVDGADVVVHLAGTGIADARWTETRLAEIRSSRIESGKLIAQAIARAEKKPRLYISASAIGYYGAYAAGETFDESARPGTDTLSGICADWEASADEARTAGVRVLHPRIGIVLAKGGGALAKMAAPFRAFVGGPLGSGQQWMSWVHLDDVVGALRFAATESLQGPVNVVAPSPVTMDSFSSELARALSRPNAIRAPSFAIRAALGEMADLVLKGQRVVPKVLSEKGYPFRYRELRPALENLLA